MDNARKRGAVHMGENKYIVEVCCGSYYDALQAAEGGAGRIELNCALALGGLTPTVSTLRLTKENAPALHVIAMLRPRGGGFCYSPEDFEVMKEECNELLQNGADGIAFGCLNEDATLNMEQNKQLISLIKEAGKEAVFHRAFDCSSEPFATIEQLITLGVDRVLTSGLMPKAIDGLDMLEQLQSRYGDKIQILAGSGVNAGNAVQIVKQTGITQIHSSCKAWKTDPTTVRNKVSYSFASGEHERMYDVVSAELVKELIGLMQEQVN